jgi:hypothetical protein
MPAGRKPDPSPRGKYYPGIVLIAVGGLLAFGSVPLAISPPSNGSAPFLLDVALIALGLVILAPGIALVRIGQRQSRVLTQCARIAYGIKEGTMAELATACDRETHVGEDKLLKSYIPLLQGYNKVIEISGDRWKWIPGKTVS